MMINHSIQLNTIPCSLHLNYYNNTCSLQQKCAPTSHKSVAGLEAVELPQIQEIEAAAQAGNTQAASQQQHVVCVNSTQYIH